MANSDPGRVVIRRKRVHSESGHNDSWKIAYADFVTAMMAFFLIMWLLSLVPSKDLKAIAEYFRMPLMTAVTGGANLDTSKSVIPGGAPSVIPNQFPLPSTQEGMDSDEQRDIQRLEELKLELENLIEHDPILQQFRPQLLLDMTPEGLRIQILDEQSRPMFAVGSAIIQPYMRDILRELAPVLNRLPNSIAISGHTDAMQYVTGERDYSNWELSADRANAARKELVAGGLVENKVKRILGLADTVNLIKDDPMAAVNRRISLLVLNQHTERRIDAQNATGQDEWWGYSRLHLLQNGSQTGSSPVATPPAASSNSATQPGVDAETGAVPTLGRRNGSN